MYILHLIITVQSIASAVFYTYCYVFSVIFI